MGALLITERSLISNSTSRAANSSPLKSPPQSRRLEVSSEGAREKLGETPGDAGRGGAGTGHRVAVGCGVPGSPPRVSLCLSPPPGWHFVLREVAAAVPDLMNTEMRAEKSI